MKSNSRLTVLWISIFGLGLLYFLLKPNCFGCDHRPARQARAKAELHNLKNALHMYHVDSRVFPSTEQGLKALVQKPDDDPVPAFWPTGGYLHKLPKDPWGRDYYYQPDRSKGEARIFTLGRDGVTGGFGEDKDSIAVLDLDEFSREPSAEWIEKKRRETDPEYLARKREVEKLHYEAQIEMQLLRDFVERYKEITSSYPTEEEGIAALAKYSSVSEGLTIPPIKPVWLHDPWGREYRYRNPGVSGEAEVFTLGADGIEGGTDLNQDLFSASSDLTVFIPAVMFRNNLETPANIYLHRRSGELMNCYIANVPKHAYELQASCIPMPED